MGGEWMETLERMAKLGMTQVDMILDVKRFELDISLEELLS